MLRNYILLAFRNIKRQPGYTVLNVLGLTVGITATLFILLYISEESRYDQFHEHADRIYRISSDITEPDNAFRWSSSQSPLGRQVKADYPEVEEYVRFFTNGRTRFGHNDRFFFVDDVYVVDSTITDVFTYNFIRGDAEKALQKPNSIAIAESVANTFFDEQDPIGEILKTASGREYEITGVYEDHPSHSHLIANALITANTIDGLMSPSARAWGGFGNYTYVLLKPNTDAKAFQDKLTQIVDQYVAVIFDEMDIKVKYEVIKITDIHLKSDFEGEPRPLGEMGFLYIFGAVAFLMLAIACINYMNLSTARGTKRAMEVGIRKVLGSERKQLIAQFLSESVIFTLTALILSYISIFILLPVFNNMFELSLRTNMLFSSEVLTGVLLVVLFTGIIGGGYPAFYLSGFEPMAVLKGSLSRGSGNPNLRKALVGVQFAITLFMIVGTGIIYDQMQYLRDKDLGFDKENVMTFNLQGAESREKFPVLQQKLLQNPKISEVSSATTSVGGGFSKTIMLVEKEDGMTDEFGVDFYGVDFDHFQTMGIEFVEGRDFDPKFTTDSTSSIIVNEAMVSRMGWSDPIGKKIQPFGVDSLEYSRVIGVVKNFHQQSLYDPIEALAFTPRFNNSNVHVRLAPTSASDLSAIIAFAEGQWNVVFPGRPFEFDFVDSAFMELYEADQIRARIFTLFSVLMIFIACLGLLGLASFIAEQRTKEVGVRKIMGAETTDIIYLLTRNFVFLVALASVPAFIAAWYFMSIWLDTFYYHANMNYWLYGVSFAIVILITVITTGYHALKAARQNPVKALRYE